MQELYQGENYKEIAEPFRDVCLLKNMHKPLILSVDTNSDASQYHLTSYCTLITLYALDGGIVLGLCSATGRG